MHQKATLSVQLNKFTHIKLWDVPVPNIDARKRAKLARSSAPPPGNSVLDTDLGKKFGIDIGRLSSH